MATTGIIQTALDTPATPPAVAQPQTTASTLPDPTKWTTTPDQTVAGQVKDLTSQDSGIIQQARTRANQKMNDRGLLNSSIAQTASDSAAYDAAIPIAQADAANASKVAGYNADEQNKFTAQNVDSQNQFGLKNLDAQTQTKLAEINTRDKELIQNSQVAAAAYKQYSDILYQNSINKDMDAAARAQADQNAFNLYQQQVSLAATLTGLPDVSSQLVFTGLAPAAQATTAAPATPAATPAQAAPSPSASVNNGQWW